MLRGQNFQMTDSHSFTINFHQKSKNQPRIHFLSHNRLMDKKLTYRSLEQLKTKPDILIEALPFIRLLKGARVVIKIGGKALSNPLLIKKFAKDVVLLKTIGIHPVIVHGAGNKIQEIIAEYRFNKSHPASPLQEENQTNLLAEMILRSIINTDLVSAIHKARGKAIGLCGTDANFVFAKKTRQVKRIQSDSNIEKIQMNYVAHPYNINTQLVEHLLDKDFIPVIAPIACTTDRETVLINADELAGALSSALIADRLLLMADLESLYNAQDHFLSHLSLFELEQLITSHKVNQPLLHKLRVISKALQNKTAKAALIPELEPHGILLSLLTENGTGTSFAQDDE